MPGYLVDTNVVSELMRDAPAPAVMTWFAQHEHQPVYVCSITQAEILTGIALLPMGKRRDALADAAQKLFESDLADQYLTFDASAAHHFALIRAQRKRAGLPITTEDAQIAAIALAAELTLVTRNTRDFLGIEGLELDNPWQDR
jgi:predicted nucleic acid-binding protein